MIRKLLCGMGFHEVVHVLTQKFHPESFVIPDRNAFYEKYGVHMTEENFDILCNNAKVLATEFGQETVCLRCNRKF